MDGTQAARPETDAANYGAAIDEMLAEMDRIRRDMKRDQAEIDSLKRETRERLASIAAGLKRLETTR
jgi:hypothetical protein